jgi:hypothetical protein
MVYAGSPAEQLRGLVALIIENLKKNYKCLYLNSPAMVAGMRSYLSAAGLHIDGEIRKGSLVLTSAQDHLVNSKFDVNRMIDLLTDSVRAAERQGYAYLWASGDMTWEFGNENNFAKLVEYECRLEQVFREHPMLCGVCQYHRDTLPPDVIQQAIYTHPAIYINETLSRINPYYVSPDDPARITSGAGLSEMLKILAVGD